jgi:hypothetical protein
MTQVQADMPPNWVAHVRMAQRRLTNDLDVEESVTVELIEDGSLVSLCKVRHDTITFTVTSTTICFFLS